MKFNWGHGIAIVLTIFVALIVLMVIKTSSYRIDLVTEDYYPKELRYQQDIDKMKNAASLGDKMEIKQGSETLEIFLPDTLKGKPIRGNYLLYRSSDKYLDVADTVVLDTATMIGIPMDKIRRGKYILYVDVEVNERSFLFKETLMMD